MGMVQRGEAARRLQRKLGNVAGALILVGLTGNCDKPQIRKTVF